MIWFATTIVPVHTQSGPLLPLPYDSSNHVWYDNDFTNDYVDWYLMAVASAGNLLLRGITTSSSEVQYFDQLVDGRSRIVADAHASGYQNIPDPLPGASGTLIRPFSELIEDTQPELSAGTLALVAAAHRAYAETGKPLVVCVGGPLTTVASAYLSDPSIADKIIVAFVDNYEGYFGGYNGGSDPWAAYIVADRLPLVYFPVYPDSQVDGLPRVSKTWLQEHLPTSPATDHMLSLELDVVNGSDGDADGMGAVSVIAGHYVYGVKRASFGGWVNAGSNENPLHVPILRDDEGGPALVVTRADAQAASAEYQRAFLGVR
jgi:hypothetical protein